MPVDGRDEIWKAIHETYYDCYYEEIAADALVGRWQWVDEITKNVVALTATGSAVAGWTLWTAPGWRLTWTFLAGMAAVLSIVHSTLGVPGRLADWGEIGRSFATLRIDLETCRYQMKVNPHFPINEFTASLTEFRKRFGEAVQRLKGDIALSKRLQRRAQAELNERLGLH
jgi:hypothetical protein